MIRIRKNTCNFVTVRQLIQYLYFFCACVSLYFNKLKLTQLRFVGMDSHLFLKASGI